MNRLLLGLFIALMISGIGCAKSTTEPDDPTPREIVMVSVPSGTFQRDATATNTSYVDAFYMSDTEITRYQFASVTGLDDPSDTSVSIGTDDPVQYVNWYHALVFCNKLSMQEGLTPVYTISSSTDPDDWGTVPTTDINATWDAVSVNSAANGYRLPTEMEWMWAAMGAVNGTTGYTKAFAGSTGSNVLGDYAWTNENSSDTTHPVGTKLPNELGLYDMSGNVGEWCWDRHGDYPTGSQDNYTGAASGGFRVERGGSWNDPASEASVGFRYEEGPYFRYYSVGFRVVRK